MYNAGEDRRGLVEVPAGIENVLGFYDVNALGLAHIENGFTLHEQVTKLISLTDSDSEKIQLAAMRELRAMRREVLEMNGLVGVMKEETTNGKDIKRTTVITQVARTQDIMKQTLQRRHTDGLSSARDTGILVQLPEGQDADEARPHANGKAAGDDTSDNGGT